MLSDRCCTLTRMKSASTIDSDGPITAFTRRRFDAVRHMPDLLLQCHHTACSCEPLDAFTWCRRVTGNILWPDSVNCRPLNLIHAGPVVVRLMCRRMSSAVNLLRSTFCGQPSAVNLLLSTFCRQPSAVNRYYLGYNAAPVSASGYINTHTSSSSSHPDGLVK